MSSIQPTTDMIAVRQPKEDSIDRREIESSLSRILEKLKGPKSERILEKGKINEEQLYAAFVYNELKKGAPAAAEIMITELPSLFKKLKENKDPKPIYGAIDKVMKRLVSGGTINSNEAKRIKEYSLGMAQVDHRSDRLGSRNIKFIDKGDVNPSTTYMDRLFSKIGDNVGATAQEVRLIQQGIAKAKEKGIEYAPVLKKDRKVTYEVKSSPEGTPPPVTPKRPNSETDVPVRQPIGSEHRFGPNELGYKPNSERDGNALVQLPNYIGNKVRLVTIVNQEGKEIATVEPKWEEKDGRRYARFDRPGNEFGTNISIRLSFMDGYIHNERIGSGANIYQRRV